MARKRKAREEDASEADGDTTANVPNSGDIAAARADDLRKWMAGESTLMAWLEEDPSQQPTFYNTTNVLDLDPDLKQKIARYEAEIESLKKMVSSGGGSTSDQEVAGLRAEVKRLTKVNLELRDQPGPRHQRRFGKGDAREKENELDAREGDQPQRRWRPGDAGAVQGRAQ